MLSKTHRLTINIKDDILSSIENISKHSKKSLASSVVDLISEALEYREDAYLSKIADEAEQRAMGKSTIPADDLWKELGLA